MRSRGGAATTWSAIDAVGRQGVQLAVTVVLARILAPDVFGTFALLSLFLGLAGVVAEAGLGSALIQRSDADDGIATTAFWMSVSAGLILTLLLCLSAPIISSFYGQPSLTPLIIVLSSTVLLNSLGAIHQALLIRRLDFRTLLKSGLLATSTSGALAILLAIRGWGEWALAAQAVCLAAVSSGALWALYPWRPSRSFQLQHAGELFRFSRYVMASNVSDVGYARLYTLLLGKMYGPRTLAYYVRADSTQQIPASILASIVSRVALPIFSESKADLARLRQGASQAIQGMMFLNVPTMLILGALSEPAIRTLFGTAWSPSAPVLQILCLGAALWPLHVINLNLLLAQGESRLVLRLEIIKKSVGLGLLLTGVNWGVHGIAWASVAFGVVAFFINAHYSGKFLSFGARAQLKQVLPIFGLALPVAAAIRFADGLWSSPDPIVLAVLSLTGGLSFVLMAAATRIEAYSAMTSFLGRGNHDASPAKVNGT